MLQMAYTDGFGVTHPDAWWVLDSITVSSIQNKNGSFAYRVYNSTADYDSDPFHFLPDGPILFMVNEPDDYDACFGQLTTNSNSAALPVAFEDWIKVGGRHFRRQGLGTYDMLPVEPPHVQYSDLLIKSAEVGSIDNSTVVVTFTDQVTGYGLPDKVSITIDSVQQTVVGAGASPDSRSILYALSQPVAATDSTGCVYSYSADPIGDDIKAVYDSLPLHSQTATIVNVVGRTLDFRVPGNIHIAHVL